MNTKFLSFTLLFFVVSFSYANEKPVVFEGQSLKLKGEWRLIMNDFISYSEIEESTNSVAIELPNIWNEVMWENEAIGSFGYGTYYRSIVYPSNLPDTVLAIEIPEVSLAYHLYANNSLIGQVGTPGKSKNESKPKIDYRVFDFSVNSGDTVTFILHISNFENKTGGLWYAPTVNFESRMINKFERNRTIKLIILGCIIIGGLFQLTTFVLNPKEKSAFYFFLVCLSLSMVMITRGYMTIMDIFPDASWVEMKKTLYLAIVLTGPSNALFLQEIFPDFFHKKAINTMAIIGGILSVYVLMVSPRVSYTIIPYLHVYNIIIGIYLLVCLIRAALVGKYGTKYLLIGYLAVFFALLHDMLSNQYVIDGYSVEMTYFGITIYVILLMFLIASRYHFAQKGKVELSNHLKKVNKELEDIIERRTKALRDKNKIIESKNAELQKAIQEKDHLMAVVAHDLKAPLSSIQGISELMGSNLEGQSAEFNDMIRKVTIDGRAMIENLTELKVFEQEDCEIRLESFDIKEFFDQKQLAFTSAAEKKDIDFKCHLDSKPKLARTDLNILSRITDNLISNAIKFTPKGGEVNFRLKVSCNQLNMEVIDNGPGFSERDKKKVFRKFQRLSARPTAGESSTGLGLSIVKTLIELLNGSVDLDTAEGHGAKFSVMIPL
ncbi:ATP-binding protein [Ekhidna sp.]|uniref:sensor histidine kinase n=1 Tax=Ekhidna sp. TaxID=2608089 RepID=UPI003B513877